jgi:saccharopine dehydrogenase-like NADP-dependent oxidoreductase
LHTVLVLGGYGFFGSRICAALIRAPSIRLLIGGRSGARAVAAARVLGLGADQGVALDAGDVGLAARLRALGVNTLIHTAGPFQNQGYAVAHAAIEAGCNYVDLADGRDFVAGIGVLDGAARARPVTVVSGASSVPALSCAVLDRYRERFQRVSAIRIGISSGARVPGLATVRGIFSYCGLPFRCWREGAWTIAHGWLELTRHHFPPPVGARWLGSCNVPDLELFPLRYAGVSSVSFQAGFASDIGHLVVWNLACMVKAGWLRSAAAFAGPLNRVSRWVEPFVSSNGAMFVTLEGVGHDGAPQQTTWYLLAGHNHGPHIPCGPAIALAHKLACGVALPAGAMPCTGLLTVEEILAPLRELDIREVIA